MFTCYHSPIDCFLMIYIKVFNVHTQIKTSHRTEDKVCLLALLFDLGVDSIHDLLDMGFKFLRCRSVNINLRTGSSYTLQDLSWHD